MGLPTFFRTATCLLLLSLFSFVSARANEGIAFFEKEIRPVLQRRDQQTATFKNTRTRVIEERTLMRSPFEFKQYGNVIHNIIA